MQGWIKIHRKLLEWEWYDEPNTFRVFMHILLKANHKDKTYRGTLVKKGSMLTSRDLLAKQTGLSVRQIRTALDNLKTTNEIAIKSSRKGSVIQVVKYASYQDATDETTNRTTRKPSSKRPTNDQQTTSNKNDKNDKNVKKKEIYIPSESEFLEHAISKQPNINHFAVVSKYQQWVDDGWKDGYGNEIKSWKHKLNNTIPHIKTDNNGKGFNDLQQQAIDNIAREFNI